MSNVLSEIFDKIQSAAVALNNAKHGNGSAEFGIQFEMQ